MNLVNTDVGCVDKVKGKVKGKVKDKVILFVLCAYLSNKVEISRLKVIV